MGSTSGAFGHSPPPHATRKWAPIAHPSPTSRRSQLPCNPEGQGRKTGQNYIRFQYGFQGSRAHAMACMSRVNLDPRTFVRPRYIHPFGLWTSGLPLISTLELQLALPFSGPTFVLPVAQGRQLKTCDHYRLRLSPSFGMSVGISARRVQD